LVGDFKDGFFTATVFAATVFAATGFGVFFGAAFFSVAFVALTGFADPGLEAAFFGTTTLATIAKAAFRSSRFAARLTLSHRAFCPAAILARASSLSMRAAGFATTIAAAFAPAGRPRFRDDVGFVSAFVNTALACCNRSIWRSSSFSI
jgi:hypothetical protein